MRPTRLTKHLAGIGIMALLACALPLGAQRIAVRTKPARGNTSVADGYRDATSHDALQATIPSLGFVELDGSMYRIEGVPGGSRLTSVFAPPSRGGTGGYIYATAAGRWVRSAKSSQSVSIATKTGDHTIDAGIPINSLALSRAGRILAVCGEGGQVTRLFDLEAEGTPVRASIEWNAPGFTLNSMMVSDDASVAVGLFERDGVREAHVWTREEGAGTVLGQGVSLEVAASPDGERLAMLNPRARELSVYKRAGGSFALHSSRTFGMLQESERPDFEELTFTRGTFVAIRIHGNDAEICGESGECLYSRPPINEVRSAHSLPANGLLFLESGRRGVPSYLLELDDSGIRWHFIGRTGVPGRSGPENRPGFGRHGSD